MGCCIKNSPPRIPRWNGLSWPPHPNQIIYWIVLITFEILYNGVLVPSLKKDYQLAGYIVSFNKVKRKSEWMCYDSEFLALKIDIISLQRSYLDFRYQFYSAFMFTYSCFNNQPSPSISNRQLAKGTTRIGQNPA